MRHKFQGQTWLLFLKAVSFLWCTVLPLQWYNLFQENFRTKGVARLREAPSKIMEKRTMSWSDLSNSSRSPRFRSPCDLFALWLVCSSQLLTMQSGTITKKAVQLQQLETIEITIVIIVFQYLAFNLAFFLFVTSYLFPEPNWSSVEEVATRALQRARLARKPEPCRK